MTSINSDFMSQLALRSLGQSSGMMTQAMERLSTGKRINSAADDAAGLGIATKLKAQVNRFFVTILNVISIKEL